MLRKLPQTCRIALALLALVAASASTARAEFISADLDTPGDGLRMIDTESGLEWLHLSQSVNFSIDDVAQSVGNDFVADGWRWALPAEMCDLYDHAGFGSDECPWPTSNPGAPNLPGRSPLLDLLGVTSEDAGVPSGLGIFGARPGRFEFGYAFYSYFSAPDLSRHMAQVGALLGLSQPRPDRGHFLVRPAPAPSSAAMAFAALAVLAGLRRRPPQPRTPAARGGRYPR